MDDSTVVKIVAIVSLVVLWTVNAFTLKIDSVLASLVVGAIAGLAGYEIGRHVRNNDEDEEHGQR